MSSIVATSTEGAIETTLSGQLLLDTPLLNKGSAFPENERREFSLRDYSRCIVRPSKSNLLAPTKTIGAKKAISNGTCF